MDGSRTLAGYRKHIKATPVRVPPEERDDSPCFLASQRAQRLSGFAYVGYRPIFMGELAFLLGILALLQSGCLVALFAFGSTLLLAARLAWTLMRTVRSP